MDRSIQLRHLVSEYKDLEFELAGTLRGMADSIEHGELLTPGAGERFGALVSAVEAAGSRLLSKIEKEGADTSNVHTIEDMERLCDQLGLERRVKALGAIQYVSASEKKYAAPLKKLQDRAAQALESLSAEGGPLSGESGRTADQAAAVLDALDAEDNDESMLADLGIEDTILLGLTRGKYSWDASAGNDKDHTRQQEISKAVNQALANSQKSAETHTMVVGESDDMLGGSVRPLSKLRNSKPDAQRFLSAVNACGPLADVVTALALFDDVLTLQLVVDRIQAQYDEPLPPDTKTDIRKTMRLLVRRGILAAYRVAGAVMYVLSRFAYESMKLPEVQHAMGLDFPSSDEHLQIVAREEMPQALLVTAWMRNSMLIKLNNWLKKEAGCGLTDAVNMDKPREVELGLRLPEGYRRAGESFMIRPYEMARFPHMGPVLYVVTRDDVVPFEDDVDEEEGSLLLFNDEVYERRDGSWVLLERTSPGGAARPTSPPKRSKPAARPMRKRKK